MIDTTLQETEVIRILSFLSKQYDYFTKYINDNIEDVYHYTSLETIKCILNNGTLRFTNINFLNDECEFTYLFIVLSDMIFNYRFKYDKLFCDFLESICSEYCNNEAYFIGAEIKSDTNRQYYISSFSLCDDSLSLWTLYTKDRNFIGCNIGINPNKVSIYDLTGKLLRGKVIYNRKEQENILNELIASWYLFYEKTSLKQEFCSYMQNMLYKYALFFKHSAFEQEQEYRFVYYNEDKLNIQNEEEKPFIDIPFNAQNDIQSVKLSPTLRENMYINDIRNEFQKSYATTQNFSFSDIPFCL